jgi:hypothetical protein
MKRYNTVIHLLRQFLDKLNFIELFTQNKLSILTICDDPKAMCTFNYGGYVWPLPQSSIIWLEYELLKNQELKGIYTACTTYKNDPNYTKKMSENVFEADIVTPKFEFVTFGEYSDIIVLVVNLLQDLGFLDKYTFVNYSQVAKRRGSVDLNVDDVAPTKVVTFVEYTPVKKWGMKYTSKVYISQKEILTFAEHLTDSNELLETFLTLDNGHLSDYLYSQFSKERVDDELFKFINTRGKTTVSCSIDIPNLMNVMFDMNMI